MNNKIDTEIRTAVAWAAEKNLPLLKGGAWFIFDAQGQATACDAIGAVLLKHDKVPAGIGIDYNALMRPGFSKMAAEILGVDSGWLHRFFMGYDRGYQVMLISEKDGKTKESKDEVSAYGISLAKEFFKKKA
jgi:hypothetical protein